MKTRRGGLGRGLGALIPSGPAPDPIDVAVTPNTDGMGSSQLGAVPGATFRELSIDSIVPNPKQPRTVFDEDALAELKQSIELVGVLQPIVVREVTPGAYELIMGER